MNIPARHDLGKLSRPEKERLLQELLGRRAAPPTPSLASPSNEPEPARPLDFSLIFFSDAGDGDPRRKYGLVLDAARFADANGFHAVWVPERHFASFGGIYPSPSVLCGALATATSRLRLRAGSVILPLQHPARVVEEWSMVDNLSGGRVDVALASGWNPNDFILSPDTFANLREVWLERIPLLQRLWRGETARFPNGKGEMTEIRVFPRPLQPSLPLWLAVTGKAETFQTAGRLGLNVLTMLMGGGVEDLAAKIALYREARARHGHDPAAGRVSLMLHSYIHPDPDVVRERVRGPFLKYIQSSIEAQSKARAGGPPSAEEVRRLSEYSFERYFQTAALFGTPESVREMTGRVAAAGVNEVACLLDFGLPDELMLESLEHLAATRRAHALADPSPEPAPTAARAHAPAADRADHTDKVESDYFPVAIVGIGGRFPQSPDLDAFWENLAAGRELIGDVPHGRWDWREVDAGGANPGLRRGGFMDGVECFDPLFFGVSPREASAMDPHQRLFIETAWEAVEDAGYAPAALQGTRTGLFVALYNNDFLGCRAAAAPDAYSVTGLLHAATPNRLSYLLNAHGPSEIVDTACSSALVAVHRAARALRSGECGQALVGGVSLMLTPARLVLLNALGVISKTGQCRAFDAEASGQVMGEGVGAILLKPLARAQSDGDHIYGIIRGSAVNHQGDRSGSLVMPSANAQAEVISLALADAKAAPGSIGYIEAHGAGGHGDLTEMTAFKQALGEGRLPCAIGSVKPNIGFGEASGGMAQMIKVLLSLAQRAIPPSINCATVHPAFGLEGTRFHVATALEKWASGGAGPRRAAVHAYGLGGVNATIILEEAPPEKPAPPSGEEQLLLLSARDAERLAESARRLAARLQTGRPAAGSR